MTEPELRAEAARHGLVLTSQVFWEVAADAIRFQSMVLERIKHEDKAAAARQVRAIT